MSTEKIIKLILVVVLVTAGFLYWFLPKHPPGKTFQNERKSFYADWHHRYSLRLGRVNSFHYAARFHYRTSSLGINCCAVCPGLLLLANDRKNKQRAGSMG